MAEVPNAAETSSLWDSLVGGATSVTEWTAEATGFEWALLGKEGTTMAHTAADFTKVQIGIAVKDQDTQPAGPVLFFDRMGAAEIAFPNHGQLFLDIAMEMASEALTLLELATALQTVSDPEGGIKIKEQLDPYHYQVVKNALQENNEQVPPPDSQEATFINKLGTGLTASGVLSYAGPALSALKLVASKTGLLSAIESVTGTSLTGSPDPWSYPWKATQFDGLPQYNAAQFVPSPAATAPGGSTYLPPQTINEVSNYHQDEAVFPDGSGTIVSVAGAVPDYTYPLKVMKSACTIKALALKYVVFNFRNAIDADTNAIITKGTLDNFSKSVSDQALNGASQPTPDWREPTGTTDPR